MIFGLFTILLIPFVFVSQARAKDSYPESNCKALDRLIDLNYSENGRGKMEMSCASFKELSQWIEKKKSGSERMTSMPGFEMSADYSARAIKVCPLSVKDGVDCSSYQQDQVAALNSSTCLSGKIGDVITEKGSGDQFRELIRDGQVVNFIPVSPAKSYAKGQLVQTAEWPLGTVVVPALTFGAVKWDDSSPLKKSYESYVDGCEIPRHNKMVGNLDGRITVLTNRGKIKNKEVKDANDRDFDLACAKLVGEFWEVALEERDLSCSDYIAAKETNEKLKKIADVGSSSRAPASAVGYKSE